MSSAIAQKNVIVIHQPDFVPHLAFFHRLLLADIFIILDDVQFLRKGWHHRDKIKTRQGAQWLTIPVQKGPIPQHINQTLTHTNPQEWATSHLNLLAANYRHAQYFDKFYPSIKKIYMNGYTKLIDLNMAFFHFFATLFEVKIKTIFSSELAVVGKKNDKLINLIEAVNGTHYLTGTGSESYLDQSLFCQHYISVMWQHFSHPVYPQLFAGFLPYLSCIDFAMNCGKDLRKWLTVAGNNICRDNNLKRPSTTKDA